MKRYSVQVNVRISAKGKREAQRIMREIIESGSALGSEGSKIAQIKLYKDPVIIAEFPF